MAQPMSSKISRSLCISRDPRISWAEWSSLLAARTDFVPPTEELVIASECNFLDLVSERCLYWLGSSASKPVAFNFTDFGILVASAEPEVFALAKHLSERLSASLVQQEFTSAP